MSSSSSDDVEGVDFLVSDVFVLLLVVLFDTGCAVLVSDFLSVDLELEVLVVLDEFLVSVDAFLVSDDDFLVSDDDFLVSDDDFLVSVDDFLVSVDDFLVSVDAFLVSDDDFLVSVDDFFVSVDATLDDDVTLDVLYGKRRTNQ